MSLQSSQEPISFCCKVNNNSVTSCSFFLNSLLHTGHIICQRNVTQIPINDSNVIFHTKHEDNKGLI